MFNLKGQSGDVFKLLIGAVIGLAIIAIIYSILSIMNNQKSYLSEEVFSNKILMAMKNPTGEEYFVNAFLFEKNKSLSKKALAEKSGLGLDCIFFSSMVESSKVIANENIIDFESDFTADVGIKCESNTNCDIFCTLTIYDKGSR
jgi:hypothetical protein